MSAIVNTKVAKALTLGLAFGIIQAFSICLPSVSHGQLMRTLWTNAAADMEFTNAGNWTGLEAPGLPGNQPDSGAGETTNAIIQGGPPYTVNLTSNFTAANPFDFLVIRFGPTLNISADMDLNSSPILLGQAGGDGFINQTAGIVSATDLSVNDAAIYSLSGGAFNLTGDITTNTSATFSLQGDSATASVGDDLTLNTASMLDFQLGATGVNGISVTDVFTIGSTSLLTIDGSAYAGGGGAITLVDADSMSGTFLSGNYTVTGLGLEGTGWTLSQDLGGSGDLVLNISPEPTSFALMLAGLAGLCLCGRRRKRQ